MLVGHDSRSSQQADDHDLIGDRACHVALSAKCLSARGRVPAGAAPDALASARHSRPLSVLSQRRPAWHSSSPPGIRCKSCFDMRYKRTV